MKILQAGNPAQFASELERLGLVMDVTTHERRTSPEQRSFDRGFTLVEILIVIVILGVLATVTVFAVRGITNRGEGASCQTDRSTIAKAAQYYLAKNNVDEIPPSGVGVDRYERTLMGEALLRDVSTYHDLQIDGSVVSPGDPCP